MFPDFQLREFQNRSKFSFNFEHIKIWSVIADSTYKQNINNLHLIYVDDKYTCTTTDEGPQKFEECILPFLHRSYVGGYYRKYDKCAIDRSDFKVRWWCSTRVDHFGIHIGGN